MQNVNTVGPILLKYDKIIIEMESTMIRQKTFILAVILQKTFILAVIRQKTFILADTKRQYVKYNICVFLNRDGRIVI